MSLSFRNKNTALSSTAVSSLNFTKPTGTASGDLLIVCIISSSNTGTVTLPSGWSIIDGTSGGTTSGGKGIVWSIITKSAGGSEPSSYTFSFVNSVSCCGIIASYKTTSTASVSVDAEDSDNNIGSANGSSLDTGTNTSVSDNEINVCIFAVGSASTATITLAGGLTSRATVSESGSINPISIALADATVASNGAVAAQTATSNQSGAWAGFTILISEAVTDSPTGLVGTTHLGTVTVSTSGTNNSVNAPSFQATVSLGTIAYDNEFDATGFSATASLGTVTCEFDYAVTGLQATMVLGTPTYQIDGITFNAVGLVGTATLGSITLAVGQVVDVTGLAATGTLGSFTYEIGVEIVPHAQPLAPMVMNYQEPTIRIDYSNSPTGLHGTGTLGTPSVALSPTATASVSGASHLGSVVVQIDAAVNVTGLQATVNLNPPAALPNTMAAITGLSASALLGSIVIRPDQVVRALLPIMQGAVGNAHYIAAYGVAGVSGTGQVGTPGFAIADAAPSVQGTVQLGAFSLAIDSNVFPRLPSARGFVGTPHINVDTPEVLGVVGYGLVGMVRVLTSSSIKQIYATIPPAI